MSWRRFFRRARYDHECAEELQSYIEIETAEHVARGMSTDDARRAAHRKLGNAARIREQIYDMNSIQPLESLWSDLRYAMRGMRRRPGFTAAVVITLALGIGANTAMFSVIDGVLVKPLPYPTADRLVSVRHLAPGLQAGDFASSATLYFTYLDHGRAFEHIGLWSAGGQTITGLGEPEQARALWVTFDVLPALGAKPQLGRSFSATDDDPHAKGPDAVIITHGFWQRRLGGDRSPVGRRLIIDSRFTEVIGVMPDTFRFLNLQPQPDVILTQRLNRDALTLGPPSLVASGLTPSWQGLALLKPGMTLEDANADVRRMLPLWLDTWPLQPAGFSRQAIESWNITPALRPLKTDVVGNIGGMLWVLMGTLGLVLLIACANVANLMLVRSEGRRHEFSLRAALGAGQFRIAKEVLVESLAFGVCGGIVGLVLAYGALRLIVAIGPADLPRLENISLDLRALAFTAAAALFSSIAFGTIPAFRSAGQRGAPIGGMLRTTTTSRERHRTRDTLVVIQVALALVLLVCSGLMIRTFGALRSVKPGFASAEEVQTMRLWVPPSSGVDPERYTRLQHEVLDKIRALPGVTAAGFASTIPMEGRLSYDLVFAEGKTYSPGSAPPIRRTKFISPGFFDAMGTRIVAGRDVSWADIDGRTKVALVSENFAREVWGTPIAALGRHIHEATPPQRTPVWREIVGVVEDVHEDGLYQPAPSFAYWPVMMGDFYGAPTFGTRATAFAIRRPQASSEGLMNAVRQSVWSVNRDMPVFLERTMKDLTDQSLATTSFALVMLCVTSVMALGLGIVGIYGVISYVVSQRAREIGLRLALGAEPTALTRMFVLYGLALTGIGIVCGLAAAAALTRLMSSLLFGIGALDPVTYALVLVVLVVAAVLASYLPARRAAMASPMATLAAE